MRPRGRRALTLAEVLVCCGLLVSMGVTLSMVYSVCLTAWRQGGGRVEVQQRSRETIRRLVPLITAAIPPSDIQDAIYQPDLGASDSQMVFSTPLDLLHSEPVASTNPRSPRYILYRIRFDPPTSNVILEDVYAPDQNRILARGINALRFQRVGADTVKIRVDVQTQVQVARFQERTVQTTLETVQQVPWYTSR